MGTENRNFIVVAEGQKVILVVESKDAFNILEKKWHQLTGKYPLPLYDIINARVASFSELKNHLAAYHGWDEAVREEI